MIYDSSICLMRIKKNYNFSFQSSKKCSVYVVRWHREPGHFLMGTAETRETYYKGIYFWYHHWLFNSLILFIQINFIFIVFLQWDISWKMKCIVFKYIHCQRLIIKLEVMNSTFEFHHIGELDGLLLFLRCWLYLH